MPQPLAVCLEDLDAPSDKGRYVQCVVVAGRLPGLGLDPRGQVLWQAPGGLAAELWVSLDQKLILWRPAGAEPVQVRRGGRHLFAPEEKPIVLLDQDQIEVGSRRLRIHLHGPCPSVHPPQPFESRSASALASLAAAAVLSTVSAGCHRPTPSATDTTAPQNSSIEVRDMPPAAPEPLPDPMPEASPPEASTPEAGPSAKKPATTPPIEVRHRPPAPPRRDP